MDDNPVNREILCEFANDWHTEYVAVSSGSEAQTAMREAMQQGRTFDVALVDIVMPVYLGRAETLNAILHVLEAEVRAGFELVAVDLPARVATAQDLTG